MKRATPPPARLVRDRLLDAVEALGAAAGPAALTHRAIARRAGVHPSLLHYHFGTIEQALEEALARRARRLADAQLAALHAVNGTGSVEDVLAALWRPFGTLGGAHEADWQNYLCLVARLAGPQALDRHFRDVQRTLMRALRGALPAATDDALAAALRFVRVLFEWEAIARCTTRFAPPALRERERRLLAFASAGLRSLASLLPAPCVAAKEPGR